MGIWLPCFHVLFVTAASSLVEKKPPIPAGSNDEFPVPPSVKKNGSTLESGPPSNGASVDLDWA